MARQVLTRHALIVDAEPAIAEILQDILRPAGMDAITVVKGSEAAVRLQNEKFDVVVVDLGTSSVPGIELTRRARCTGFNRMTPIILISGDCHRGVFGQGFKAGASFIVHKPIDRAHLIKLLRVAQGAMERERRRFRRMGLGIRVQLTFANSQVDGETVDLSLNGALIRVTRTFPVGSAAKVDLYLPSAAKPISGVASVRRISGGNLMGIQMDGFSLDDSGRLQDYLLPLLIAETAEEVHR